ncbi:hypothetical protein F511_07452 [Dorcoceras hygrometricum]|uniref:Uncharacterized protein n=1 Tax=Dorcoceras hygrometricum TaxID=472368 RepID=A0A2Z7C778_9LAMI|nr:hypothetical protein F511_07452 [Dorcoceras hygrometricum]
MRHRASIVGRTASTSGTSMQRRRAAAGRPPSRGTAIIERPPRAEEAPDVQQRCATSARRPAIARQAPDVKPSSPSSLDHLAKRHFTVGGGRYRQSGPRQDARLLRQPALEGLTRSARTDSPRQNWPETIFRRAAMAAAAARRESCKNQLVVVSVRYGPNPYIPIRSTTIGKSRVAIDPIAMHTSWRSNSDIASVTSIGYPRMSASGESSTTMHRLLHVSGSHPIPTPYDPKTNQYNQDLGLIHSTNGNHLESPNEGSSIDHQVTIYLHAQNITMFPINETWYFASQILVSNSGGPILILTVQSTKNMFRIHSDY